MCFTPRFIKISLYVKSNYGWGSSIFGDGFEIEQYGHPLGAERKLSLEFDCFSNGE